MIIHAVVLGVLVLYTIFAWNSSQREAVEAEKAAEEAFLEGGQGLYPELRGVEQKGGSFSGMVKVGVPMLMTVIYGGVLTVLYILPMFVDKLGEEIMGSSAEVEDDPRVEARAAVAAGDYSEAIQVYRREWLKNREDRYPVVEIAKLQRVELKSPVVAVSTLEEALEDHEWAAEDGAFLMFRIAEIYEEDLDDREALIVTLKKVVETLDGTRHSANAAHRLRELGAV